VTREGDERLLNSSPKSMLQEPSYHLFAANQLKIIFVSFKEPGHEILFDIVFNNLSCAGVIVLNVKHKTSKALSDYWVVGGFTFLDLFRR
jgi:hypothetical protein